MPVETEWEVVPEASDWESIGNSETTFADARFKPEIPRLPGALNDPGDNADLLRHVANNPWEVIKSIPEVAMGIASAPGKLAYGAAADLVSKVAGQPEYGGNLEAMQQAPDERGLPAERFLGSVAKTNPKLAVLGYVSKTLPELASMMAVNPSGAAGKLLALGFSADMIHAAKPMFDEYATEYYKPDGEKDPAKLAQLTAGIIQTFGFAPLAGAHGLGEPLGKVARDFSTGLDNARRFSPEAPQPSPTGSIAAPASPGARFPIPEQAASVLDSFVPESKESVQPVAETQKSPATGTASEWEVVKEPNYEKVGNSALRVGGDLEIPVTRTAEALTPAESIMADENLPIELRKLARKVSRGEATQTEHQTMLDWQASLAKTMQLSPEEGITPSKPAAASPEPVVSEAVPTEKAAPAPTETPKQAAGEDVLKPSTKALFESELAKGTPTPIDKESQRKFNPNSPSLRNAPQGERSEPGEYNPRPAEVAITQMDNGISHFAEPKFQRGWKRHRFVYSVDGKGVAMLDVMEYPEQKQGDPYPHTSARPAAANIHAAYTLPEYQRKGIMQKLVLAADKHLPQPLKPDYLNTGEMRGMMKKMVSEPSKPLPNAGAYADLSPELKAQHDANSTKMREAFGKELEAQKSSAKEPWQMTREEWYEAKQGDRAETFDTRNKKSGAAETNARIARKARLDYGVEGEMEDGVRQPVDHRQVIEKALKEGKQVPAVVLEKYPDLKNKELGANQAPTQQPESAKAALADVPESSQTGNIGKTVTPKVAVNQAVNPKLENVKKRDLRKPYEMFGEFQGDATTQQIAGGIAYDRGDVSVSITSARSGSDYVTLTENNTGETVKIRFADHFAPGGGGFRVTEMGSGREAPPDFNIVKNKIYSLENGKWEQITLDKLRWHLENWLPAKPEASTPTQAAAKVEAEIKQPEPSATKPRLGKGGHGEELGQGTVSGAPLSTLPPVPTVPPKAISQIIRDLSDAVGTPIRFGRLTTRKFGGYFKGKENLIGAKTANDIQITSHEVGHKLDDMFKLGDEKSLRAELMHLGDNKRPDSRSSWTPSKTNKYRRGEGVAEFIRYWLTDEPKAKSLAPNLTAHFESILKKYPDLSEQLKQSQEDVHNWRTAEPQARLMSSVSVGANPNKTRYTLKDLTRDLLDDLHYLKLAVEDVKALGGGTLEPSKNPYVLARLLRGGYGVADTFLNHGTVDFNTRNVTKGNSFNDILKPVSKRLNDFRAYIIARQAREMRAQGKETGLEKADVDFTYDKFKDDADFNKAFEDLKKWSDSFIQYSVDAGYMSKESADKIRTMNQEYVPMHRIFEVGADEFGEADGGSGRGLNQVSNAFKGRHGSKRDIVDPLETYVKNAYSIILNAEKNAVNIAIADLAGKPGFGQFVEKIATPKQIESASLGKLREELENAGADLSKVTPPSATVKNPSPTADDLLLTFWKDSAIAPRGENIIKVNRDGKLEFYRLSPELYKTMNALDSESASMLSKIISAPAQVLRAGVTLTPDFAISNATRDTFSSAIISRYGKFPVEHTLRGLYALLKDPQLVAEWKASGGGQSVEANYYDRASMQKFLQDKISKDFSYADYVKFVATSPLKAMRILSGTLEEATRIGEYKRTYDKLKADGMSEGDARRQAGFESRDLQDFAMGGAKTKSLRRATAFWNAAMQGNYRLYQSLKDPATRNQTLLKGFAWVTVPTVTLFAVNKDDKDYWDRPQWERDLFWLVPRGKDEFGHTQFLRVPKPFEIGLLFGTVPERAMARWFKEDPKAFDGLAGQFANQMIPNPVPQAVLTSAEVSAGDQGYDWFKHRPIVSGSLEHLPPDLQFNQQSTVIARRIGKALGVSPLKVDHVISGFTGTLGKTAVNQGIDRVLEWLTGDKRTARSTFPGARFVATPAGTQSQAVENFYAKLEELRQEDARDKATKPAKLPNMEAAARRLSELRKQQNKATTDSERQRIALQMRTIAEKALK